MDRWDKNWSQVYYFTSNGEKRLFLTSHYWIRWTAHSQRPFRRRKIIRLLDMLRLKPKDLAVPALKLTVQNHTNIFCNGFSSVSTAEHGPPKIVLVLESTAARVPILSFSNEQGVFLSRTVEKLVNCWLDNINPTSPWASAPLSVPKPRLTKFHFSTDL